MSKYDEQRRDLIERTDQHWENGSALSATEEYIRELLPEELKYAQQCLGLKQSDDCDTLVLLLGFSTDPLLQSICVYQPRRIVLICNEKYLFGDDDDPGNTLTGREWAKRFCRYIGQLQKQGLYRVQDIPRFDSVGGISPGNGDIAIYSGSKEAMPEVEGETRKEITPDWVFRQLCERIIPQRRQASAEERKKKIVVDITGAKKNMMAGAFLFADYAGAKISYVDFDDYDARRHRPYGFTCRIGEQPNPYRVLSLRDWTRVRGLYERFFFRSAAEEVAEIERRMSAGITLGDNLVRYFDDPQCEAVKVLGRVLRLLELWDNGDHTAAWNYWTKPSMPNEPPLQDVLPNSSQFSLPSAVKLLGSNKWPSSTPSDAEHLLKNHFVLKYGDESVHSVFARTDWILIYAEDEIAKIKRLIKPNEDYRSAFLRAAALDELLLKARVALLWVNDKLSHGAKDPSYCLKAISRATNSDAMRSFLQYLPGKSGECKLEVNWPKYENPPGFNYSLTHKNPVNAAERLSQYWLPTTRQLTPEQMVKIRGESIHTYLPIPEELARAAFCIADYSLEDFVDNWARRFDASLTRPAAWQPDWEALCQACGITFLPPTPEEEAL